MSGVYEYFFTHLLDRYPSEFFHVIAAFIVLTVTIGICEGTSKAKVMSLIGYCFFLLYITVFSRTANEHIKIGVIPFSTYIDIANGDRFLLPQVLMNIVMFIPIGFLVKAVFREWSWKKVMACGLLSSLLIELLQLALMKGVAEVDDLIHNTLGCMIGYWIYKVYSFKFIVYRTYKDNHNI